MTLEELSASTKLSRVSYNSSPSEELRFGDITFDFANQSVKIGSCSEISEETTREGKSLIVEIVTSDPPKLKREKISKDVHRDGYYDKIREEAAKVNLIPKKKKITVDVQKFNRAIKTLYTVIKYGEDVEGYQTAKKYLKK